MSEFVTPQWLKDNTTLIDPKPGDRVTLAQVTTYEIGEVDATTGALLLHKCGASGRPSKNGRPVKTRLLSQVVKVVASLA